MSVQYRDYYKILGVSKEATQDEIRSAFRKLARKYHPDVAKNQPQAEDKFKEINEAYEVLGDPAKRKKYDTVGSDWGGFPPPPGGSPGGGYYKWTASGPEGENFEFGGTGFSDFFEQLFGRQNGGGGPGAGGFRGFPGTEPGFGRRAPQRGEDVEADIMVTLEEALQGSVRSISLRRNVPCPTCKGTGNIGKSHCSTCAGSGIHSKVDSYKVKIPAGVKEGQKLRIAGRGEEGPAGAGDLFLNVRFASHPDFRVVNGVLQHDLDLTPWEAALGASISVPTLEGPVQIKIPAGIQTGQKLRIKGKGLQETSTTKGDLHVIAHVKVPTELTAKEKELWEQLKAGSAFNPRA